MTEQEPTISPKESHYEAEISISDLLIKLWAKRGLIFIFPLILAGLTVTGLLLGKTSQQTVLSYYIELNGISVTDAARGTVNDSSSGSGNGGDGDGDSDSDSDNEITTRYPNGVVFSPQDLKNPSVLQLLAKDFSLSLEQLAQHINVDFGTPFNEGVLIEYEAALAANSSASAETLATINERYRSRFSAYAKRGLKISVNYIQLGIPKEVGQQLALDIATTWNTVFTTQFKTRLSPEAISQRVPMVELDVASTVGFLAAENQLKQIEIGTINLAKDGRLAGLATKDGTTASDLIGYLEDFRTIYFDPLYVNAFAQNSSLSRLYQRDIQLKIDELSEDIAELNRRLDDIQQFKRGALTTALPSSRDQNSIVPQYGGSGLNEVVSLAERATLSSYLEKTLDARMELTAERAALQTKLRRIGNAGSVEGSAISEDFIQVSSAQYENLVKAYGALIETARKILIAETPSYFASITQPITSDPPIFAKRDMFFIALALTLGGMLAVIAALIWPQNS